MAFIIFRKKNVTKFILKILNILRLSRLKVMENLPTINLEKLCPWSLALASTIPVLDLEKVCPRKVGPWP